MTPALLCLWLVAAQPERRDYGPPAPSPAEYGHGLTPEQARAGWLSLFDGYTVFGWQDSKVRDGSLQSGYLQGGQTSGPFADLEVIAEIKTAGTITFGTKTLTVPAGTWRATLAGGSPAPLRLSPELTLKSLIVRPLGLQPLFNGQDLAGWKVLPHPKLPAEKQAQWSVDNGAIRAVGGPGALEWPDLAGDFLLQAEVTTQTLTNGGLFTRAQPGQFMLGYESQIFNACYDNDPAKPARYSTGAIDDRQLARRLVSRDHVPFTETVLQIGPHFRTWVNGYQMTDWVDTRAPHENPRLGLRLEPGTIQLQAHDPETDVAFGKVLLVKYPRP